MKLRFLFLGSQPVEYRLRLRTVWLVAFLTTTSAVTACAQDNTGCSEALVLATYNRVHVEHEDWRLASYVSEHEYEQIKHDAGVNAVIYGVPVGASYSDFQKRVHDKVDSFRESLTRDEATSLMWTGLDPNSPNLYAACLQSKIFNQNGIHLNVSAATKDEVSVVVDWRPTGNEHNASPQWSWTGQSASKLPKTLQPGLKSVVLPRPKEQKILSVNFLGHTDSLVIAPFPKPPEKAQFIAVETTETYTSPEIVGWGDRWSDPYPLCTPQKPEGWIIETLSPVHLASGTERGECGRWTDCGNGLADAPTRACRVIRVQGHNENRFDGYGRAVASIIVTWRHPQRVP